MTKDDIIKGFADEKTLVFDTAVPQAFANQMNKYGVSANEFVWCYDDAAGSFGRPLSIGHFFLTAMSKGNLVPLDVIDRVIDMVKSGDYSPEEIKTLVKQHCSQL